MIIDWGRALMAKGVTVGPMNLTDGGILPTDNKGGDIPSFFTDVMLPQIANFLLGATLSIAVLMVIVGGFMFIYSGGDQEKRTKGRDIIMWAIIGVVIAVFSYGAVQIVLSLDYLTKA